MIVVVSLSQLEKATQISQPCSATKKVRTVGLGAGDGLGLGLTVGLGVGDGLESTATSVDGAGDPPPLSQADTAAARIKKPIKFFILSPSARLPISPPLARRGFDLPNPQRGAAQPEDRSIIGKPLKLKQSCGLLIILKSAIFKLPLAAISKPDEISVLVSHAVNLNV
jgi:hypothetical protein